MSELQFLSAALIEKQHTPAMEHDLGINVDSQFLQFCGITASSEPSSSSSIWHTDRTDDHAHEQFASVDSLLQDYAQAFTPTGDPDALLTRARVDAILMMSLAIAKKKKLLNSSDDARSDAEQRLQTLFWGHEQVISLPVPFLNPSNIRNSALDYVLWYGNPRELETNLIVVRIDESLDGTDGEQYLPTLAAMYGILTDSLKWVFFHVNKEHKYSALKLNWLEDQQQAIVGLIGRIMDRAVIVKIVCEESNLNQLPWTLEWTKMATIWDIPQWDHLEKEEIEPLADEDDHFPESSRLSRQTFHTTKMDWFAKIEQRCKQFVRRAKRAGQNDDVEEEMDSVFNVARVESQEATGKKKALLSIAVTDIPSEDVMEMFRLKRERKPNNIWKIASWERRTTVSSHLAHTLENIKLVAGREGAGKRASTETTLSRKSLEMALEAPISYVWPTVDGKKVVRGHMDYTLWYGKPSQAETNLMVVEAKKVGTTHAGRYQAISYMAHIQDARRKAGRANTPIFEIATDSRDWDFIRLDAYGQLDIESLSWEAKQDVQIMSLLHKVVHQASCLSPVSSNDLTRQKTVEKLTGIRFSK
ncbi:hypothetical protein BDW59DRAFT_157144 [Aspergillus cavernicola]|uniref:Uncharacterized protein n=1 Tax=Aspergillus cavernicola TaxID=176166 RepID=A0ABR4IYZ3_9EURO